MALHVFWPASACLTLFVVGVIMIMLKYGRYIFPNRHRPLPTVQEWEAKSYAREISVSMEAD